VSGKAELLFAAMTTPAVRTTVFHEGWGGGAAAVIEMVMLRPPRKEGS
jgi:hypothetical protein